jgi:hypothetical protein
MCDDSRVAPREAAGAPEDDIEVTREMIAAADEELRFWDRDDPWPMEVIAVYRAMERARRSSHGRGSSSGEMGSPA